MTELTFLQWLGAQTLLFSTAVLVVALLRPLLVRCLDAGAVYLSWLLVPLVMLAPALPTVMRGQVLPSVTHRLDQAVLGWLQVPPASEPMAQATAPASRTATPSLTPALLQRHALPGLVTVSLAVWALGVCAALGLMALRQHRYSARLQRGEEAWLAPAGDSPAMLGLWRPRLVLPADFGLRFTPGEQALILAHEAVHARRHDNAWNLLGAGLLVLQWFNPLAWWALHRMRQDQELACDAAVLNRPRTSENSPPLLRTYVQALLKSHPGPELPVLSTGWAHRHPLLERVRQLARHVQPPWRRHLARLAALSLCVIGALLAQSTRAPQPIESSGDDPGTKVRSAPTLAAASAGVSSPVSEAATPPVAGTAAPVVIDPMTKSAAAPSGPLGLVIDLQSQQGGQAWQRRQMSLALPTDNPLATPHSTTLQSRQGDWCLGVVFYFFADNTLRPMAEVMDRNCQRTLTGLVELPLDKGTQTLFARLPDAGDSPLQVQLSLVAMDPRSAQFAALREAERAARTPQQRAESARLNEEFRQQKEAFDAQDRAWRLARGEQP